MSDASFLNSPWFVWVILPLLIFLARITDVTIGTVRIIFLSRGKRFLAPVLGFFEVLIWLMAIGQIFKHMDNTACYLAYAFGFATGNFVGITIENKLAVGMEVIRVVTRKNAAKLIEKLKSEGFGMTLIDGEGATGPVKIIFTLIRRKERGEVIKRIQEFNPKAFYSIEDVRFANEGVFSTRMAYAGMFRRLGRWGRKGK